MKHLPKRNYAASEIARRPIFSSDITIYKEDQTFIKELEYRCIRSKVSSQQMKLKKKLKQAKADLDIYPDLNSVNGRKM